MNGIIYQTEEEKFEMYMKLSKKEIVRMLMENQRIVNNLMPTTINFTGKTHRSPYNFADTCSCNPKNGGSGICNCTLGARVTYSS
jgi:hypothetical protein